MEMEEQWRLYEAYNELHGLAQELKTPFDAPAVLVVGHQTDGKSALVEALMGFQFNHVGGGTKTRRPITLHMKYDPQCELPVCHLVPEEDNIASAPAPQKKSLHEIQVNIITPPLLPFFCFDANAPMRQCLCHKLLLLSRHSLNLKT